MGITQSLFAKGIKLASALKSVKAQVARRTQVVPSAPFFFALIQEVLRDQTRVALAADSWVMWQAATSTTAKLYPL